MESDPILILTLGFVGSLPYDSVGARAACAIGAGFKLLSIDLAGFFKSPSTAWYSQLFREKTRSSALNASTHTSKVAHSPCAPVPLSVVQKK
jgi:hypothetical protein